MIEDINYLQQSLILHSYIYYELDDCIISDFEFDNMCFELWEYMGTDDFKESRHYYAFEDFDGSTGYHLIEATHAQYDMWLAKAKEVVQDNKDLTF